MVKVYGIGFTTVFIDCLLESLGFASGAFGKCGIDQWGKSRNHRGMEPPVSEKSWHAQKFPILQMMFPARNLHGLLGKARNARNLHGLLGNFPAMFADTVGER
jgi:hypothetical protein